MRLRNRPRGKSASARTGTGPQALPRKLALERKLSALASTQKGTVGRDQLLALGFTAREIDLRIASGRLIPIFSGVYAVGHSAISREGRWLAATLAVGSTSALSYRDAGALWRMPDFTFLDRIDVTLPGTGSRSIKGIRVHRSRDLNPAHIGEQQGIPVTSAAWTVLDLASTLGFRRVRQCFDVAARRGDLDLDEVAYLVDNGRGHRGRKPLALLAGLDRTQAGRTRSVLELDFLAFCREEGLPEPLINHTLDGFEVDACWPYARLVVELDSWEFHGDRESFERDRAKSAELQAVGFSVIQVTNRRLKTERPKIADTIWRLLDRADADRQR